MEWNKKAEGWSKLAEWIQNEEWWMNESQTGKPWMICCWGRIPAGKLRLDWKKSECNERKPARLIN